MTRPYRPSPTGGEIKMGWGWSFWRGFVIFLWSIAWAIIGTIIAILIASIAGISFSNIITNPNFWRAAITNPEYFRNTFTNFILSSFIGIAIGTFIAVIGGYASIHKIIIDDTKKSFDEVRKSFEERVEEQTKRIDEKLKEIKEKAKRAEEKEEKEKSNEKPLIREIG